MYAVVLLKKSDTPNYAPGACKTLFVLLEATMHEKAEEEAKTVVQGIPEHEYATGFEGFLLDERNNENLEFAKLVFIEQDLPIQAWYQESIDKVRLRDSNRERELYERLKKKYEGR